MAIYLKMSETDTCAKLESITNNLYQITWFDIWFDTREHATDEPSLVLSEKTTIPIQTPWLMAAEILSADHPLAKAMDKCEVEYYNDYARDIMLRA